MRIIIRDIRGTRTVLAERTAGGFYLDFVLKRDELARYGLSVQDAEEIIMSAVGGENVTTTVEAIGSVRERECAPMRGISSDDVKTSSAERRCL